VQTAVELHTNPLTRVAFAQSAQSETSTPPILPPRCTLSALAQKSLFCFCVLSRARVLLANGKLQFQSKRRPSLINIFHRRFCLFYVIYPKKGLAQSSAPSGRPGWSRVALVLMGWQLFVL